MSYDSVTRINKFFKENIEDASTENMPNGIYTIYEDLNEGLDEPSDSPFCKTFFEASFSAPTGISTSPEINTCFVEDGIFIVQVFATKGLGNKYCYSLSDIVQQVGDIFSGAKLLPESGERGVILFENIETRQTIEIERRGSNRGYGTTEDAIWKRKDIFINYQKNYTK